jgi:AmiR/NasT family two-component response regulator
VTSPGRADQKDERAFNDRVTAAVAEIAVRRSVIDQAKGMLMLAYGIDADKAFAILQWRSQLTNVKLVRLAQQLLDDFGSLEYGTPRTTFDALLLTGHERIHPAAAS